MPFLKMRPSKEGRCQLQHRPAKHFCPHSTGQQESSLPSSFFLTPRNAGKDRLPWWQAHCTKVMPITRKKPCTNSRECTGTIVWPDDEKPFISIFLWLSPCSLSHLVLWLCYSCHSLPSSELDFLGLPSCVRALFAVIPGDSRQSQIVTCSHFADRHSVL